MKPKSSDFVSDAFGLARHSRDVRVRGRLNRLNGRKYADAAMHTRTRSADFESFRWQKAPKRNRMAV
jgi:hypothetical protein